MDDVFLEIVAANYTKAEYDCLLSWIRSEFWRRICLRDQSAMFRAAWPFDMQEEKFLDVGTYTEPKLR